MSSTSKEAESIELQPRDMGLLRGLFESRIMTAVHASAIHFDGKPEATKKRLQKLKSAGYIGERKRRVNQPSILFLTRKGFNMLSLEGELQGFPQFSANAFEARVNVSEQTLNHELEVMDVKTAFHSACLTSPTCTIVKFSTWPLMNQFETPRDGYGKTTLVKPDGFLTIHEQEQNGNGFAHDCFLELDRSSETQETLVNRTACYLDYYRTGGFAVRNGATASDFKSYPFRVLIVLKNAERRNNTAERLAQRNPPILSFAWLTTLAEVTSDPLGAIWIQPKDYRDATAGTPFDVGRRVSQGIYRSNPKREALIESKVQKRMLVG